jgi:uncharacterized protein YcbX
VTGVWRYPVKSLQGEALTGAVVERDGVRGDRCWGIRDGATGRILTARRRPELLQASASYRDGLPVIELPDGREVAGPGPESDRRLSDWLGAPVSLVTSLGAQAGRAEYFEDATDDSSSAIEWTMPESRFVDAAALLVLTTASLRAAAALQPASSWEPRRFRPNVLVDADLAGFVEDGWVGRTLAVGEVRLRVDGPCPRCVMTTLGQGDLPKDPAILRAAAREHGGDVGVYATVLRGGRVRRGDAVTVA